jgi:membrane protein required for beta-lactamase induction
MNGASRHRDIPEIQQVYMTSYLHNLLCLLIIVLIALSSTSRQKIKFDMTQLKYIALRERNHNSEAISQSILPTFSRLIAVISGFHEADKQNKAVQLAINIYFIFC